MTELSDKEAQELFAQASAAIKEADNLKLNELMSTTTEEEEEEQREETTSEESEVVDETTEEEQDKTDPPSGKTEEATEEDEGNDPPKDELSELREQLQKMQKENHALRSQAGRMPHVQRKIKELDAKLEELKQRAASPSNRPSTVINEKVKDALKGIGETDPELATAIAQAVATAISGQEDHILSREQETLKLLREQEYSAYQSAEVERLLEVYPNAPEVFNSPSWKQWKSKQTERVLALAESDSADDVFLAFDIYAKDMLAQNPELGKTEDTTAKSAEENAKKAAQIEQERKRKQATSVVVGSPAAQGKVSLPDDPQALFERFSSEIRKNISG